jgi:hypothetical protein
MGVTKNIGSGGQMSWVFPSHKNKTFWDSVCGHFDSPKLGENIYRSRTAINRPPTGRNRNMRALLLAHQTTVHFYSIFLIFEWTISSWHNAMTGWENIKEQDRQCVHKRNIEARSRNRYCLEKAVSITHSECMCVCSLSHLACKAHALYCIVICGLSGSTIFFHVIS